MPRSRVFIIIAGCYFAFMTLAMAIVGFFSDTPIGIVIAISGGAFLLFESYTFIFLRYVKPWLSLPSSIELSPEGVKLFGERGLYATIANEEIIAVSHPSVSWFTFLNECTKVECKGDIRVFYVLPYLTEYSAFVKALNALIPRPETEENISSFSVNWFAYLFALGFGAAILVGSLYWYQSDRDFTYLIWSLIALLFLFAIVIFTPMAVSINTNKVTIRYFLRTLQIPKEDLIGVISPRSKWAGDYYKTLLHNKGKIRLDRCYFKRFEALIQALQSLIHS